MVIEAPPRHGKSEFVSKWLIAWYLACNPEKRAVLVSHDADFAKTWGRKVRSIFEEFGPEWFEVSVSQDKKSAGDWDLERYGGGLYCTSAGGPLTGRGANLMVIDDVLKSADDALSQTVRERHWNWWQSVASTRLEPGALVVVMMTRWHEDDLSGRLLAAADSEDGDPVYRIHMPAIAEAGDWLGRDAGQALWPERFDLAALHRRRKSLDAYWWEALFQQSPRQHGSYEWPGEYFGQHLWCDESDWPDRFEVGVIAVDPSKGKDARKGDYSGIVFSGLSDGMIWVDADLKRRPVEQIVTDGLDMAVRFAKSLHGFAIETNQFQELLVGEFERQRTTRHLLPLPIFMINNTVNKKLRIGRLGPYFAQRKIRMRDTPDNRLLIDQCRQFTMREISSVHDDGPDSLEMSIRTMVELQGGTGVIDESDT